MNAAPAIAAAILPLAAISEETIDEVIHRATDAGLVACNCTTGPFRVSFFSPQRIPRGWARIGLTQRDREPPPCDA